MQAAPGIRRLGWGGLALVVGLALAATASAQEADRAALQAERDRLFQQMLTDPGNLDLLFAYAQAAIALEDFDAAIATYERMLIFNPDLPRIHLELGVLYFRQGAYDVAQYHLQIAKASPGLPPLAAAKVDEYLAQMAEETAEHRFDGSMFFGLRYQTNANSAPPAGTQVQIGPLPGLSELDDDAIEQEDMNLLLSGIVAHKWDLGNDTYDAWITELSGYGAVYFSQQELDLATLELRSGPQFNEVAFEELSVRPFVVGSWMGIDHATYFWSYGGGIQLEAALAPNLVATLEGQVRGRDYGTEYDDRDGTVLYAQASLRYALSPNDLVVLTGAAADIGADSDFRAYYDLGGSLAYTRLIDLNPHLPRPLAVTGYAGGRVSNYAAADPFIEPDTQRRDHEWRIGLSAALALGPAWSAIATTEYRDVSSNVPIYAYDNLSVTVGALFRF